MDHPSRRFAPQRASTPKNLLLRSLSSVEHDTLAPQLERVTLAVGQIISEPLESSDYFYFPENAAASLVIVMSDGRAVEAATVGNEGVAGLAPFLGRGQMNTRCLVQIEGEAQRMQTKELLAAIATTPRLGEVLGTYTQAFINQLSQSVACNGLHTIQQRCARWLLMTHDRVGGRDSFDLTQEFLSFMLGVRREAVSSASRVLKQGGIIRYARGHLTVLDRPALEEAACECYAATRDDYSRLLS